MRSMFESGYWREMKAVDDDLQVGNQSPSRFPDGLHAVLVWLHRSL